jgi:hypothetical protein
VKLSRISQCGVTDSTDQSRRSFGPKPGEITNVAIFHPTLVSVVSPRSRIHLCFSSFRSLSPLSSVAMDAHARSLLERLNTSASPKPIKSSSAPDPKPSSTVSITGDVQDVPTSPSSRTSKQPSVGDSEEAMSVKDLLDSARQRSRETSHAGVDHVASNPTQPLYEAASSLSMTTKADRDEPPHMSDGASSGNVEETFATPSGSNNSSVVSNTEDSSRRKSGSGTLAPPQGRRIPNNVSCLITLSPMKPDLPRLQMKTDSSGRTFVGDGIEQIANLSRTFGVYDREILGATEKYIVYALKGGWLVLPCISNRRGPDSDYRPKHWNSCDCRNSIFGAGHKSYDSRRFRWRRILSPCARLCPRAYHLVHQAMENR